MVLNRESIDGKLNDLDQYVENLIRHSDITRGEFINNLDLQWIIERGITLCAEVVFDIGNHLLKAEYGITPKNNEEVLTQLNSKDVISDDLYKELKRLEKFRNLLIHDYAVVDPEKVFTYFQKTPATFRKFIKKIIDWLDNEQQLISKCETKA